MKKLSLKMVALIAAMMMCLSAEAKTEDVGGRVIDAQGIYKVQRAMWMVSSRLRLPTPAAFCDSRTSGIAPSILT